MSLARIGVCYYPEHWPEEHWSGHAHQMRDLGISEVRIGEFAWSRLEVARGEFHWEWLDRAIETLAGAGLNIILCTPTACPPRWLIDELPEVLPVDQTGATRRFGSRRHYRFASKPYLREAVRISRAVIERYARHPAIVGWQLDNEYGCHETVCSFSPEDERAFQDWLARRYSSINQLNHNWGTVFWSQEYRDFSEVGLPNQTVTEANPAHWMDFRRFSSDQVTGFNRVHADLLKQQRSDGQWLTHNFMGNFTEFDHFDVAADLDVATWDSYPLGFLDQGWASSEEKLRYRRIGHPDWAAFHHDLYRAVGRGRFGVMEQQPGPVNWAPANAQPLANAPAFWAMEAIAHGAELVAFFRFQQIPRAQEQLHAALRLSDGSPAPAWQPVADLTDSLKDLDASPTLPADVAMLFDYASCWATDIQPHAPGYGSLEQAMECYSAIRSLGLDLDIVGPEQSLDGYKLLLIPGSVFVSEQLVDRIEQAGVRAIVLPRSGSRQDDFSLPEEQAPGPLQRLIPLRVVAVDSMRAGAAHAVTLNDASYRIMRWRESVETELEPRLSCEDGTGLWFCQKGHHYIAGRAEPALLRQILRQVLTETALSPLEMPEGLRRRRRGVYTFIFNFFPEPRTWIEDDQTLVSGSTTIDTGAWSVWRTDGA